MFLIRAVQKKDVSQLIRLANTPGMFNFPSTQDGMLERIEKSEASFQKKTDTKKNNDAKYVFVAENLNGGEVVATSMIAAQHGTPDSPHYYFKVGMEKRYSQTLQTGFIHGTLTLKTQTDGPSELGALVVSEEFRNNEERVGRQIFFVRLLFLHQNRKKFRDSLLAELLPPLNKKGHSPLWEAIGRRFTNLDYWEADALSAKNKEFIFDLFPQGKIYTTFLAADARNSIGKVGVSTEPVLHLLKRIGFVYPNEIDPFDGGPHLRAGTKDIVPLKKICRVVMRLAKGKLTNISSGLIAPVKTRPLFGAVQVAGELEISKKGESVFYLDPSNQLKQIQKVFGSKADEVYDFLPYF